MLTRTFLNSDPFGTLSREMDRLFETFAPTATVRPAGMPRGQFPAMNLWQTDEALFVEAELPGFRMEDIELFATEDALTIKGQRSIEHPEKAEVIRAERATGRFERVIGLPTPVDTEKVEASLTNGVLRITLPKAAAVLPRRIAIQPGQKQG